MLKIFTILFSILTLPLNYNNFEVVKIKTNKRMNISGKTSSVDADVYYSKNGKMVTFLDFPKELVIINDSKGQLSVHDVKANTVTQKFDNMIGTENSQLFYFLQKRTGDMGLSAMGFVLDESNFEGELMISKWKSPENLNKHISYIELVHEKRNPIFLGYFKEDGTALKKAFFYNYDNINGIEMPLYITEINYFQQDSTITKTVFSDIEFDTHEAYEAINYKIPSNATLVEK